MSNSLVKKLRNFAPLCDDDAAALDSLFSEATSYRAKHDLLLERDEPHAVFLLLKGWGCRYKILPNGKRQIMAFLLPGDLCNVHSCILEQTDHSIGLLSDAEVAAIPKNKMLDLFGKRPNLSRALLWSTLTDEAILRQWLVNIGRRDAYERVAHLLVELWLRLRVVGHTIRGSFELRATQSDLADALGLTSVHTNRTLQRLRSEGLIKTSADRVNIPDLPKLMEVAGFQSNYLHLDSRVDAETRRHRPRLN